MTFKKGERDDLAERTRHVRARPLVGGPGGRVFRTTAARARGPPVDLLDDAGLFYVYGSPRFGPLFLSLHVSCAASCAWRPGGSAAHAARSPRPLAGSVAAAAARVRARRTLARVAVFRMLRRLPHPFTPAHRAALRYQLSFSAGCPPQSSTGRSRAAVSSGVIRGSRPRAPRSDATDLLSARRAAHAWALPHARPHRGRGRPCTGRNPRSSVPRSQALRTETTINDTYDFAIVGAPQSARLRTIGFAANRRLLHVESLSHNA